MNNLKEYVDTLYCSHLLLVNSIQAHEKTKKNLTESELRFHLLAENATDIISRHSPNGTYLYVSPSCKALLGYSPDELINQNIYQLSHPEDTNKLKKVFTRRKTTHNNQTITYRTRNNEGEYRWFESNVRIIYDNKRNSACEIQCASRDITDRILDKKARLRGQQLAHVFRLSTMEEMASGMAHEISQPLAAVVNYTRGCVRYLQKEHQDTEQVIEIMNKAVSQAERAGEVIHRLKNFFCKGQLFKTPCKMNSLIRETVTLIRHDLNKSKTKIDFDFSKEFPQTSIDKIQIQQVILNLIQNAIEAMQENPPNERKIHIETKFKEEENMIEIIVIDAGPGFSKENIHKVFKPFFTTKANGRGMGLAICRSIIEAHGGQFTITSNIHHHNPNCIQFTLPVI